MSELHVVSREKDGLDSVGSLELELHWRVGARVANNRRELSRPWHDEDLRLPLEAVTVDPSRVLFWDNEPTRLNSTRRASHMLANRAVPLVVRGGNTFRNMLDLVTDRRDEYIQDYERSRVAVAKCVLAHLATPPDRQQGHHRRANLHAVYRYAPPLGEDFERILDVLRSISQGE